MVVISIIAPSVNVLRRTPSTIRGAAPDVVIGQSTAARAGAHPYLSLLGQFWSRQSPRTKNRQRQPVRLLLTRHSLDLNSEITAVLAWIGLTVTE